MTHNSPLASPRATINRLAEWGITTKKSLGQHFLIDDGVVGRILRLASIEREDRVLEIGPGIGTLTEALLLKGSSVLALEKDGRLLPLLSEIQGRYPQAFKFLHIDALDYVEGRPDLEQDGRAVFLSTTLKLVANLPYSVAATIVLDYFRFMSAIQSATVMVQKEVADRMAAQPGSKDYGAYSVKLQLIASPKASFQVSRTCFLPPPRVDSTVIRFDRRENQIEPDEIPNTFMIIEAAFAERRKTIRNSMRSQFVQLGLGLGLIDSLLELSGIPPSTRAEVLNPEDFLSLGRKYLELTASNAK